MSSVPSPDFVGNRVHVATLAFTRPENTTAYDAGDVVGIADSGTPANAGSAIHLLTWDFAPRAGALLMLVKAELVIGLTSVTSGMGNFRGHLYNEAPTAILDNAAFDLTSTDKNKHAGFFDLTTPEDLGSQIKSQAAPFVPFKLLSTSQDFRLLLETRGGYTPASATAYGLRLTFAEIG